MYTECIKDWKERWGVGGLWSSDRDCFSAQRWVIGTYNVSDSPNMVRNYIKKLWTTENKNGLLMTRRGIEVFLFFSESLLCVCFESLCLHWLNVWCSIEMFMSPQRWPEITLVTILLLLQRHHQVNFSKSLVYDHKPAKLITRPSANVND